MCPCKIGEQTTRHILFDCELLEQERYKPKAEILRSENWPVNKDTLINLLKPNVNYSGRTAPLTSKVAFYIFIQQI